MWTQIHIDSGDLNWTGCPIVNHTILRTWYVNHISMDFFREIIWNTGSEQLWRQKKMSLWKLNCGFILCMLTCDSFFVWCCLWSNFHFMFECPLYADRKLTSLQCIPVPTCSDSIEIQVDSFHFRDKIPVIQVNKC